MKTLKLSALLTLTIALSGCVVTDAHLFAWDYVRGSGWMRSYSSRGVRAADCFDENGDVLPACSGCYDAEKHRIPGCTPGRYEVSPLKAELDAKISAKIREEHCRRVTNGTCICTGLAYPWSAAQKKVYPACDPSIPAQDGRKSP